MTKVANVLCVAAVSAGLLAGCGAADPEPAPSGANVSTTVGTQVSQDPADSGDPGAGVEDRSAEAVVEQTVSLPDSPEDKASVGIQSLTVDGETMVLRLVITPDFATADDEVVSLGDAMDVKSEFFGTKLRLLDRQNLKEYEVIHESNKWWASSSSIGATNGEPIYAFAVFAAPEDDIDTIDVRISEQWPEFTAVPIVR